MGLTGTPAAREPRRRAASTSRTDPFSRQLLAATFPYERAYLPVARTLDGTVHSW